MVLFIKSNYNLIPRDSYLVTPDVTSLCTSILITSGLVAAQEAFNNVCPQNGIKPFNSSLIELLDLVLNRNNFQFNNVQYVQIKGCAMETRVPPTCSFANTYLGTFEKDHFTLINNLSST